LKVDIGYIGFSEKLLAILLNSEYFNLTGVIWEDGRFISNEMCLKLQESDIPLYKANSKEKVAEIILKINCKQYIMYQCSFIIPAEIVKKYQIFNIHPGDLKTNRGANPLIWSILLQEPNACMSLYRVNENIDTGWLVDKINVPIDISDDSKSIVAKVESVIPRLLEKLYLHLTEKTDTELVQGGIYRRRIQERDYTIQLGTDSFDDILAKIRSQAAYKGAVIILNNIKFFVTGAELYNNSNEQKFGGGAAKCCYLFCRDEFKRYFSFLPFFGNLGLKVQVGK